MVEISDSIIECIKMGDFALWETKAWQKKNVT